MKNDTRDNAGIIFPPPLIYLIPLIIGLRLQQKFPVPFLPPFVRGLLGGSLVGSAVTLISTAFKMMNRAGTNVNPTQPTTTLVMEGPFRLTRNPLYLGLTLLYGGIALLSNSVWAVLLLPVVLKIMNRSVIEREEAYLESKFGEQYLNYKQQVQRWL